MWNPGKETYTVRAVQGLSQRSERVILFLPPGNATGKRSDSSRKSLFAGGFRMRPVSPARSSPTAMRTRDTGESHLQECRASSAESPRAGPRLLKPLCVALNILLTFPNAFHELAVVLFVQTALLYLVFVG